MSWDQDKFGACIPSCIHKLGCLVDFSIKNSPILLSKTHFEILPPRNRQSGPNFLQEESAFILPGLVTKIRLSMNSFTTVSRIRGVSNTDSGNNLSKLKVPCLNDIAVYKVSYQKTAHGQNGVLHYDSLVFFVDTETFSNLVRTCPVFCWHWFTIVKQLPVFQKGDRN